MTTRIRGRFTRDDSETPNWVPGYLHVADDGSVEIELLGSLGSEDEPIDGFTIYGTLAKSTFGGDHVTFQRCLRINMTWGAAGRSETWMAHRALFGRSTIPDTFRRVVVALRGLDAFLGKPPRIVAVKDSDSKWPSSVVAESSLGDERVLKLVWRQTGVISRSRWVLEQSPAAEIHGTRMTLEECMSSVTLIETMLTLAARRHQYIESISVEGTEDIDGFPLVFHVIGPRVQTVPTKNSTQEDFLFTCSDLSGRRFSSMTSAMQSLMNMRNYISVFMSNERSPPRYLDDKVHSSILSFGHLTTAFACPEEEAPAQLRGAGVLRGIPAGVRLLAPPSVGADALTEMIATTYRWVAFREGEPIRGSALLQIQKKIRALIHLGVMNLLGFNDGAERLERVSRGDPPF